MTDRTPTKIIAEFVDGPMDGQQITVPHYVSQLLIVLESGKCVRYECDSLTTQTYEGGWDDVCRLTETRQPDEFDGELCTALNDA